MKKIILVILSGIALCSSPVWAAPELKGTPQDLRGFLYPKDKIVTITAQAEEKAYSDKAIVSLMITTEEKLLSQAIDKNADLRQRISSALRAKGLAAEAIKSSKFSSSPEYGWFGSKPSSYKVNNRMAITIDSEKQLQAIAALADEYREAELSSTVFEHSKKEHLNQKGKAKALDKVLKQKAFYEQSLGIRLKAIGVRENQFRHRPTRGAEMLQRAKRASEVVEDQALSSVKYKAAAAPKSTSFDEVRYE
ncbi:SIMPL domain-containing protein, partial [bacterium]|nr:SIMPL domain-containing protein [bacterium]